MKEKTKKTEQKKEKKVDISPVMLTVSPEEKINTDPFGSYTGVPTDDPYERPIQDQDDL